MKILVTGSGGRLGGAIEEFYGEKFDTVGLGRGELDLASADSIDSVLRALDFDVLINCAALTNVDYCESHPEEAEQVNARAVGRLAGICKAKKSRLIHISTDYVFGGSEEKPLTEEDEARPLGVYGKTKLEGERLVLDCDPGFTVVRVSWIFGPHRPSFVDMILQRAMESDTLEAIADKYSSPTYSFDFAKYLEPLLDVGDAGGLIHLCNAGGTTWQEYGEYAIGEAISQGIGLKAHKIDPIKTGDMKSFIASRPIHTVMSTARYTSLTGITPRPWREAVSEYIANYAAPRLKRG